MRNVRVHNIVICMIYAKVADANYPGAAEGLYGAASEIRWRRRKTVIRNLAHTGWLRVTKGK